MQQNLRQAVHPPLTPVLHEVGQPLLPVVRLLLAEGLDREKTAAQNHTGSGGPDRTCSEPYQSDGGVVLGAVVSECDPMLLHVGEVLLGLFAGTGTQTCSRGAEFGSGSGGWDGVLPGKEGNQPL